LPITYEWRATGQEPLTRVGGLDDAVVYAWDLAGTKTITVTATNAEGSLSDVHPFIVAIPPAAVDIAGPPTGTVGAANTFQAAVAPITATTPLTYVWQATGQEPVTRVGGLNDTLAWTWTAPGTYSLTVTAANIGGEVVGTHALAIRDVPDAGATLYVPLVVRDK
jgi:hypothetical protein